ncbi:MAG: hypothetical protein H6708_10695 [Kofleriaceae bacterium]|nr:hypothetical protein [Kofleriaceae bacterium]
MRGATVLGLAGFAAACGTHPSPPAAWQDGAASAPAPIAVTSSSLADAGLADAGLAVAAGGDAGGPLAQLTDGTCDVAIEALLAADIYRGVPQTQAWRDALARQPDRGARWEGRAHGQRYLACTYRVRIGAATYRYQHTSGGAHLAGDDLDVATCATAAHAAAVARTIVTTTERCTDLHSHEYWGDIFEPL